MRKGLLQKWGKWLAANSGKEVQADADDREIHVGVVAAIDRAEGSGEP